MELASKMRAIIALIKCQAETRRWIRADRVLLLSNTWARCWTSSQSASFPPGRDCWTSIRHGFNHLTDSLFPSLSDAMSVRHLGLLINPAGHEAFGTCQNFSCFLTTFAPLGSHSSSVVTINDGARALLRMLGCNLGQEFDLPPTSFSVPRSSPIRPCRGEQF